jgi:hypothetical protein
MGEERAVSNVFHATAAYDWFPRVAEELELLEAGMRSWRTDAAERLRAISDRRANLTSEDGELLAVVAVELAAEEDEGALQCSLVTWRTLAADDLSALAQLLRGKGSAPAGRDVSLARDA